MAGTVSPGPSFVMIARTALSTSRAEGIAAALGMGAGGVVLAAAALLGLHALLLAVPSIALKIAGGLYLTYLGLRIWASAKRPLGVSDLAPKAPGKQARKAFALGFTTQVSNPKPAIVYAGVFAAFLPSESSMVFNLALIPVVFVIEAGWYALVATTLASEGPRNAYLRYKRWVNRAAGGVMMALGLNLVSSAHR
ncbi:MAG: LysE family translocator [Variovorax sp.]|nr:MAG: LysE family translocator [Variovorax sp.]